MMRLPPLLNTSCRSWHTGEGHGGALRTVHWRALLEPHTRAHWALLSCHSVSEPGCLPNLAWSLPPPCPRPAPHLKGVGADGRDLALLPHRAGQEAQRLVRHLVHQHVGRLRHRSRAVRSGAQSGRGRTMALEASSLHEPEGRAHGVWHLPRLLHHQPAGHLPCPPGWTGWGAGPGRRCGRAGSGRGRPPPAAWRCRSPAGGAEE